MASNKETKEFIVGSLELSIIIMSLVKDGVQFSDVAGLIAKLQSDPQLQQKLQQGIEGVKKIPGEVSDLDMLEVVDLVTVITQYIPKMITALK